MIVFDRSSRSCSKNLFLYYVLLVFAESTPLSNGLLLHSWVFPEPSRKNMTLRRICHFYKVSFGKTSLNFRSKSYFVNPISHDGYLPSLRLMFCHQIKNMSTWLSPISTIVAPVTLLLGHYKNLRLVSLWRREISHLEKEK